MTCNICTSIGRKFELREPFDGPKILASHADLVLYVKKWQERNSTLPQILLDQFFGIFSRILWHGSARFWVQLTELQTTCYWRKQLMKMIRECPYLYVVKPPCSIPGKQRSTTWGICNLANIERVRKDDPNVEWPTHMAGSPVLPVFRVVGSSRTFYTIPADRHKAFAESWRDICLSRGNEVTYDYVGDTVFGRATFAALDVTRFPERVDWSAYPRSDESLRWAQRVYWSAISGRFIRVCRRKWGRLYHPLVNIPKWLRRKLLMLHGGGWEGVAEVDMSCTYWVSLVSMLAPCAEREELMDILSGVNGRDFYTELNNACSSPYTSRNEAKPEVQKQTLFWKIWYFADEKCRPLWLALKRRFPQLAALINSMRRRMNGSELSEVLTRSESAFFVDHMLPMVHEMGIPVLTVHDCLVVPRSTAQKVLSLCQQEALSFFGFVPKFGVVYES